MRPLTIDQQKREEKEVEPKFATKQTKKTLFIELSQFRNLINIKYFIDVHFKFDVLLGYLCVHRLVMYKQHIADRWHHDNWNISPSDCISYLGCGSLFTHCITVHLVSDDNLLLYSQTSLDSLSNSDYRILGLGLTQPH